MSAAPGIRIEDLSFSIGSFAFHDLSFEVKPAEYFVLAGPNGSGKTVLLKLISGILRPESGKIFVNGGELTMVPPWERAIGYVPQDGLLFPHLRVAENVEFGLKMRGTAAHKRHERAEELLEMLGISSLAKRAVKGLSGGERQKVALARALAVKPSVLLLDEPVSAIDESARDSVCRELKTIQRTLGITTIHVSHNSAETALVADRVGRMCNGTITV